MPSPYDTPVSDLGDAKLPIPASQASAVWATVGSVMSSLIFVALGSFVFKMYQTFQEITLNGTGDPKLMAAGLSAALVPAFLFGLLSCVGLTISIATVFVTGYRKRWFYVATITFATASLLFLPVGTVLGGLALILFFAKRREFREPVRSAE